MQIILKLFRSKKKNDFSPYVYPEHLHQPRIGETLEIRSCSNGFTTKYKVTNVEYVIKLNGDKVTVGEILIDCMDILIKESLWKLR